MVRTNQRKDNMGSFNMTCFASQQTVAPGDACRVLPLLQQSSYSEIAISKADQKENVLSGTHSTCYYDAFWSPLGGFIPAEAEDYGRVELALDAHARMHLMGLFSELLTRSWVTAQGDNEYHDLAFDFAGFLQKDASGVHSALSDKGEKTSWREGALDAEIAAVWGYIWEVSQKNRVFISDYRGRPRALGFALIHEDAYAELLTQASEGTDWDDDPRAPEAVLRKGLEAGIQKAKERAAKYSSDMPNMGGWHLSDNLREVFSRADGVGHSLGGPVSGLLSQLCESLWSANLTKDEFIELSLPLLEERYVLGGLNGLNLKLSPMVTAGQDYDNSTGKAYSNFVAKVSAKVTRGRQLHYYGEFQSYVMQAPSQDSIDAFLALIPECDAAIENVVTTPAGDGIITVQFDCTLDLDDLREVIEEELEGGDAMAQSLQERASEE